MLRGGVGGDEGTGSVALRNTLGVVSELSKEVEAFRKEQYTAWEDWISEELDDMANWKNNKLMTFDSQNSHIRTHFNDQLVLLLREVRQLQSLGFGIRKDIINEVEVANKFYRGVSCTPGSGAHLDAARVTVVAEPKQTQTS
ncbi:hypothetical protein VOLCADRAFT_95318 [Volvox carteri f. nagariensis]|uniref:Dynein heavy chain tail domain-containing protein n=1 Tax=Volvox carteri f. nagariensis TaxID=3068 RepID=D8U752_VOLCA|nr:uncharacterized protein VOLCADRAFT_95318 [Volvox carteri f. nagariensis]EFJ44422.1 hypothetical protein VOLCADRAFT_95318 [Volvox carteri f. nagariensis]|eukprot:XP_002954529.1 hypothetical protein VOLCADRAFT_95318 [Volvox carteri f. nagariensis]